MDDFDEDYDTEDNCRCGNAANERHPCPLLEPLNQFCVCCDECMAVCAEAAKESNTE